MKNEKLCSNLYGVHLKDGEIDTIPAPNSSCFFIVHHMNIKDCVKKHALHLLLSGCRDFYFFGNEEPLWHLVFDEVDIMINPDSTTENVALTSGYSTLDDFIETLDLEISTMEDLARDRAIEFTAYDRLLSWINPYQRLGEVEQKSALNNAYNNFQYKLKLRLERLKI